MLQTWAQDGTPMLRLGDRLYKFIDIASVGWNYTGEAQRGTIVSELFTRFPGCEAFAFTIDGGIDTRGGGVSISISGNVLTWEYPYALARYYNRLNTTFVYGVY